MRSDSVTRARATLPCVPLSCTTLSCTTLSCTTLHYPAQSTTPARGKRRFPGDGRAITRVLVHRTPCYHACHQLLLPGLPWASARLPGLQGGGSPAHETPRDHARLAPTPAANCLSPDGIPAKKTGRIAKVKKVAKVKRVRNRAKVENCAKWRNSAKVEKVRDKAHRRGNPSPILQERPIPRVNSGLRE